MPEPSGGGDGLPHGTQGTGDATDGWAPPPRRGVPHPGSGERGAYAPGEPGGPGMRTTRLHAPPRREPVSRRRATDGAHLAEEPGAPAAGTRGRAPPRR